MVLRITQIITPKLADVDYSQALPMQIGAIFTIRSGDDLLEGMYTGSLSPMLDARGSGIYRPFSELCLCSGRGKDGGRRGDWVQGHDATENCCLKGFAQADQLGPFGVYSTVASCNMILGVQFLRKHLLSPLLKKRSAEAWFIP
jgi:hypothetical protein